MWARHHPSAATVLRLPLVRHFSAWYAAQPNYVQMGLNVISLAMALLLAVAAGYLGLRPPSALTAKAQAPTHELAAILYGWMDQRPALPSADCGPFEPAAACRARQAADVAQWESRFAEYVRIIQAEQERAEWVHDGKDFPTYNRDTGVITFTLALQGAVRADEKNCLPFRIIAQVPSGITTGPWPDQGGQAKANTDIRQRLREVAVKPKPFPHPCLRTAQWTAWARVEPETAQVWAAWAKDKGWKLEMFFHLDNAECPLAPNWDEDARLTKQDFAEEQRIWLWVDEVRLAIGDAIVQRWR
ncbi:MAG: hypothetical protein H5T65_06200 [Chloroflexi bacterium]|nr:hypothetical protein [Chloroflexota bacterium]